MKNNIWFLVACALFFVAGYSLNNSAISFPRYKVAVVDISKILENSQEIKTLKISQEKQMKEINTLVSKAQNELANEKDPTKIAQLEAKYRKEIETKRNSMDEEYNTKIAKITEDIKKMVTQEANKTNYNLVLPTGMVISGGEDITPKVIKDMK